MNQHMLQDLTLAKKKPEIYWNMLQTAEQVAKRYNIARDAMDEYGAASQQKACAAAAAGKFDVRRLDGRRAALTGSLGILLSSLDLLLMPVMGTAVWTIGGLERAGRDPETVAARLRYTAPFDMSGHPTLTLPGGMTADGVPVGFQIVGDWFGEAAVFAAGHAYQQASDWHRKRPAL